MAMAKGNIDHSTPHQCKDASITQVYDGGLQMSTANALAIQREGDLVENHIEWKIFVLICEKAFSDVLYCFSPNIRPLQ